MDGIIRINAKRRSEAYVTFNGFVGDVWDCCFLLQPVIILSRLTIFSTTPFFRFAFDRSLSATEL